MEFERKYFVVYDKMSFTLSNISKLICDPEFPLPSSAILGFCAAKIVTKLTCAVLLHIFQISYSLFFVHDNLSHVINTVLKLIQLFDKLRHDCFYLLFLFSSIYLRYLVCTPVLLYW